jgi:hypothetical protein
MQRARVPVGKVLTLPAHGYLNRECGYPVVPVIAGNRLANAVPTDAKALQSLLRT